MPFIARHICAKQTARAPSSAILYSRADRECHTARAPSSVIPRAESECHNTTRSISNKTVNTKRADTSSTQKTKPRSRERGASESRLHGCIPANWSPCRHRSPQRYVRTRTYRQGATTNNQKKQSHRQPTLTTVPLWNETQFRSTQPPPCCNLWQVN